MLALGGLPEGKESMKKEEAVDFAERYRERMNEECNNAISAVNKFTAEDIPIDYAMFLILSRISPWSFQKEHEDERIDP